MLASLDEKKELGSELVLMMVAGEASADLHGAMVVKELKRRYPGIRIIGVGGQHMIAAGFEPIAESSEISVMGVTEVVHALPRIIGVAKRLLAAADKYHPQAAILMDLPDFNLRLAKFLKRRHIPLLYYISPQVWAWRQGRVKKIKKLIDKMLVILPFEADFYQKHQVPATFVGHPLVEEQTNIPTKEEARKILSIPENKRLVALLPGSRKSELARHMADLLGAANILNEKYSDLSFVLPVAAPFLRGQIDDAIKAFPNLQVQLLDGQADTALLAADVAAVCSGTATLQTALLGCPMVVFYRLSSLSYHILKRLLHVKAISLVNIISGKSLVKELIQNDFSANTLASELSQLLDDDDKYNSMKEDLSKLRSALGEHQASLMVADSCAVYLQKTNNEESK